MWFENMVGERVKLNQTERIGRTAMQFGAAFTVDRAVERLPKRPQNNVPWPASWPGEDGSGLILLARRVVGER